MSVAERHLDDSIEADDLAFALDQVKAGNFADAQKALARAKSGDPRNIFIMALEKQIARLKGGGVLPREKTEIIDSLPGLIQRAKADRHGRDDLGEQFSQTTSPAPSPEKKDPRMKMVVDQYFKHADDWVRRGDFEAALKEVERVLLIEPDSRVAKEYRTRVKQLIQENAAPETTSQSAALRKESAEHVRLTSPTPARVHPTAPPAPAPAVEKVGKKKALLLISVAVVVVVAMVGGLMMVRPASAKYKPGILYVTESPAPADENMPPAGRPQVQEVSAPNQEPQSEESPEISAPKISAPEPEPVVKRDPPKKSVAEEPVADPAPKKKPEQIVPFSAQPAGGSEKTVVGSGADKPSTFIPVEMPPKLVALAQPVFSSEELASGAQGDIIVKVQIDKSGKPLQAKVVSSTNTTLNGPVVDAVMRSSYSPGMMSNGPVTTWMTVPMRLK